MYARLTQYHVVPERLKHFQASFQTAVSHAREQRGYRALIALRGDASATSVEVRIISIWNSIEDLQAVEQNFYFYQALAKVMASSKGFPLIEGQEVLAADFGGQPGTRNDPSMSSEETQF
ncbi:MAG TPA: antibiotic biosynthesis monooxygenase [Candidatus Acidoferrales bacterium]|nr:antibiotic biosynthesis monooxygenase [Candidatus Acidoferrales bacterium]